MLLVALCGFAFLLKPDWAAGGRVFVVVLVAAEFLCAAFLWVMRDATSGWSVWRPFTLLGRLSYACYLFHAPIAFLLIRWMLPYGVRARLLAIPLSLALTIGAAMLSYRFIEAPFLRLKRRFERVPTRLGAP